MAMIVIRFPDDAAKRKALGFLLGRFSFKTWATGEVIVPDISLSHLALEGIPFTVEGPANYERLVPAFRNPAWNQCDYAFAASTCVRCAGSW